MVALAAGLLAAFLVQRLTGVSIPRWRLKSKAGAVAQTYQTARGRLAAVPGDAAWKKSTLSDVGVQIKKLKDEVDTKTTGAYVSIDQKVIDALDAAIVAAEVLVARFGELADVLPALADDLKRLRDERPKQLPPLVGIQPPPDEPALAAAARVRLAKRELATSGIAAELDAVAAERKTIAALASGSGTLGEGARSVASQQASVTTAAGSWTATASMSTARGSMTATRLSNGRVLVVGEADVSTAELYDPPTGGVRPAA